MLLKATTKWFRYPLMYGRTDVELISAVGSLLDAKLQGVCQQIAAPDWSLYYFLANHSVPFSEIFVFYFLFFFSGHYVSSFCSVFPKNCIFALSKSDSRKCLMYIIKSKCYHRSNISWQQLKIQFDPYSQVR